MREDDAYRCHIECGYWSVQVLQTTFGTSTPLLVIEAAADSCVLTAVNDFANKNSIVTLVL